MKKSRIIYFIKNFKFNSVFVRNFLFAGAIFAIPLIIMSAILLNAAEDAAGQEAKFIRQSYISKLRDIGDSMMENITYMGTHLSILETTAVSMQENWYSNYSHTTASNAYRMAYTYIDSIYFYSDKLGVIMESKEKIDIDKFDDTNWMSSYGNIEEGRSLITIRKKKGTYPTVVSIINGVYINRSEKIGCVVINVDLEKFCKTVFENKTGNDSVVILKDEDGNVIYSNDYTLNGKNISELDYSDNENGQYETRVNSTDRVVSMAKSNLSGFTYISVNNASDFEHYSGKLVMYIFWSIFFYIFLGIVTAVLITYKTYDPIATVIDVLSGKTLQRQLRKDEIGWIVKEIRKNAAFNTELKIKLEEQLKFLTTAQLSALQSQMNPHFIYNTIDVIRWMAFDITGSENPASEMLVDFSELVRFGINSEQCLITLKEELNLLKCYVNIMNVRYKDRFKVKYDIEPEALNSRIIKLSLQPLVENAITHGILKRKTVGEIKVKISKKNKMLNVCVSDNGIGMSEENLIRLKNELKVSALYSERHIGLKNVCQRIKIIFGEEYDINISSVPGNGTTIQFSLPDMAEEDDKKEESE